MGRAIQHEMRLHVPVLHGRARMAVYIVGQRGRHHRQCGHERVRRRHELAKHPRFGRRGRCEDPFQGLHRLDHAARGHLLVRLGTDGEEQGSAHLRQLVLVRRGWHEDLWGAVAQLKRRQMGLLRHLLRQNAIR